MTGRPDVVGRAPPDAQWHRNVARGAASRPGRAIPMHGAAVRQGRAPDVIRSSAPQAIKRIYISRARRPRRAVPMQNGRFTGGGSGRATWNGRAAKGPNVIRARSPHAREGNIRSVVGTRAPGRAIPMQDRSSFANRPNVLRAASPYATEQPRRAAVSRRQRRAVPVLNRSADHPDVARPASPDAQERSPRTDRALRPGGAIPVLNGSLVANGPDVVRSAPPRRIEITGRPAVDRRPNGAIPVLNGSAAAANQPDVVRPGPPDPGGEQVDDLRGRPASPVPVVSKSSPDDPDVIGAASPDALSVQRSEGLSGLGSQRGWPPGRPIPVNGLTLLRNGPDVVGSASPNGSEPVGRAARPRRPLR